MNCDTSNSESEEEWKSEEEWIPSESEDEWVPNSSSDDNFDNNVGNKKPSKELQNELNEVKALGEQILGADISNEDVEAWIAGNGSETDVLLTDNDILAETNDVQNDSSSDDDVQIVAKVKHQDAVRSFNNCIQWASENNIPDNQIELLFELKNIAVKKDVESKKQKNITDFFKSYTVCEKHFHDISIERIGKIKPYAVPVLHLPNYWEEVSEENCFSYSPIFNPRRTPNKIRGKLFILSYSPIFNPRRTPNKIRVALDRPSSSLEDNQYLKVKTPEKTYQRSIKRKLDYSLTFEEPVSTSTCNINEVFIPEPECEADPKLRS
ncbi:hypothetical protein QE152_g3816 [Popillia japonica]|uniref:Uncharacterized protein n=1 Tax=Popillia japonica TaxID=7064 RepID=A0AAW1N317_POPJA